MRRKLGMEKVIATVRKIEHHEKRIADDTIQKVTIDVINQAVKTNAVIILGNIQYLGTNRNNRS